MQVFLELLPVPICLTAFLIQNVCFISENMRWIIFLKYLFIYCNGACLIPLWNPVYVSDSRFEWEAFIMAVWFQMLPPVGVIAHRCALLCLPGVEITKIICGVFFKWQYSISQDRKVCHDAILIQFNLKVCDRYVTALYGSMFSFFLM